MSRFWCSAIVACCLIGVLDGPARAQSFRKFVPPKPKPAPVVVAQQPVVVPQRPVVVPQRPVVVPQQPVVRVLPNAGALNDPRPAIFNPYRNPYAFYLQGQIAADNAVARYYITNFGYNPYLASFNPYFYNPYLNSGYYNPYSSYGGGYGGGGYGGGGYGGGGSGGGGSGGAGNAPAVGMGNAFAQNPPQGAPAPPQQHNALTVLGIPNDQGEIRWPLAFRLMNPDDKKLLAPVEASMQAAAAQAGGGRVTPAVLREASQSLQRVRQWLNEHRFDMADDTLAEGRELLLKMERALLRIAG